MSKGLHNLINKENIKTGAAMLAIIVGATAVNELTDALNINSKQKDVSSYTNEEVLDAVERGIKTNELHSIPGKLYQFSSKNDSFLTVKIAEDSDSQIISYLTKGEFVLLPDDKYDLIYTNNPLEKEIGSDGFVHKIAFPIYLGEIDGEPLFEIEVGYIEASDLQDFKVEYKGNIGLDDLYKTEQEQKKNKKKM